MGHYLDMPIFIIIIIKGRGTTIIHFNYIFLRYFTLFAITISCLGLYGLITHVAEQRTKEVGIRKVLGASIPRIIRLLTIELLILVTAANIVAWPLAYFAMNKWLQNFAFRTNMGIEIFILAGGLTAVIAVLTLCLKAVKAAQTNPLNSLRYE